MTIEIKHSRKSTEDNLVYTYERCLHKRGCDNKFHMFYWQSQLTKAESHFLVLPLSALCLHHNNSGDKCELTPLIRGVRNVCSQILIHFISGGFVLSWHHRLSVVVSTPAREDWVCQRLRHPPPIPLPPASFNVAPSHTMDMLWENFHWILPLYMKPINFQSKASFVCSVTTALFIDFCLKKLSVFSQHIGTKTNEYLKSTEKTIRNWNVNLVSTLITSWDIT